MKKNLQFTMHNLQLAIARLFIFINIVFISNLSYSATIAVSQPAAAPAGSGIQIKKASAVVEQKQENPIAAGTGTNLIGTAINLFQGIQTLQNQELALSKDCAPTNADVEYVNKMVKEYAKIANETADDMRRALTNADYNESCRYKDTVGVPNVNVCYDAFDGSNEVSNAGGVYTPIEIWGLYPKASESVHKCPQTNPSCTPSQEIYYSNIYEIYSRMGWTDADLLPDELSTHAKLMEKRDRCDPTELKRKKQELTGALITSTLSGVGTQQNTGNAIGQVTGLLGNISAGGGGSQGTMNGVTQSGLQMLPLLLEGGGGTGGGLLK